MKFTPLTISRDNPGFTALRGGRHFNGLKKKYFFAQIIEMPLKTNTQTKKYKKLMAATKLSLKLGWFHPHSFQYRVYVGWDGG